MKNIIFLCILFLVTGAGCATAELQNTDVTSMNTTQQNETRTLPNQSDLAAEYGSVVLHTNQGDVLIRLYADDAPITVNNFLHLAKQGFYNGTKFHRIISNFMIQGGDPLTKDDAQLLSWGTGGPEYRFADEFNAHPLVRGSIAMANAGPNTNGSQFFIVTAEATAWLDQKHTNFGMVEAGMDVVARIEAVPTDSRDVPKEPVIIESIELLPREI